MDGLASEINELHSQICAALADPKRIYLLYLLNNAPATVTQLTHALQVPQPTVSRHLKILRERGLVHSKRDGQSVYYSLTHPRVIDALDILRQVLAENLLQRQQLAEVAAQSLMEE